MRAVTGSVSWALPFGFVTDFRGGGGRQDGGKERKKEEEKSECQRGTSDILAKLIFIYHWKSS